MDFPKNGLVPMGFHAVLISVDVRTTAPKHVDVIIKGKTPEETTDRFIFNLHMKLSMEAAEVRKQIEDELSKVYGSDCLHSIRKEKGLKFVFEAMYPTFASAGFFECPKQANKKT